MEANEEARGSIADSVGKHAPLLATAALFTWVVLRVLSVAGGNKEVAKALVSSLGPVDVALGVLASSIDQLAVAFAALFGLWTVLRVRNPERDEGSYWLQLLGLLRRIPSQDAVIFVALIIAATWILILTSGWIDGLYTTFSLLVLLLLTAGVRSTTIALSPKLPRPDRRFFRWQLLLLTGGAVLGFWVMVAMSLLRNESWLPAEIIATEVDTGQTTESETIVGYVLDDSEGWMTLLTYDDRTVLRVKSNTVRERVYCQPTTDPAPVSEEGLVPCPVP